MVQSSNPPAPGPTSMATPSTFIFCSCQYGAQAILKQEILSHWPEFKFAFSRPGFVTFKVPEGFPLKSLPTLDLKSTFTRTSGICLGKVQAQGTAELLKQAAELVSQSNLENIKHLHLWQRDTSVPGERQFEPGRKPRTDALANQLADLLQPSGVTNKLTVNKIARPDEKILDIILVEDNQWWIGWHQATTTPRCWPGGVYSIVLPEHIVSRAYLKMEEAIQWSRLPMKSGDLVAEIGSSPGGSCQALLKRRLNVLGIDPAQMHESLLEIPEFTHIRKKVADMKRSDFSEVKWLMSDSNVAPNYTLDSVEHIVTSPKANIRGMLLTLKMIKWELAADLPAYLDRIRSWGYQYIRTRQLAFNRQEICVAVMKSRGKRKAKR